MDLQSDINIPTEKIPKRKKKKKSNEKVENSRLCPLPIRGEAPTTGPVMSRVGEIADKAHTRRWTIEVKRKKRKGIFVYVSVAVSIAVAVSVYL